MPLINKVVKCIKVQMNIGFMGKTIKKVFDNRRIESITVLAKFWYPREAEESHCVVRSVKLIGKPLLFY